MQLNFEKLKSVSVDCKLEKYSKNGTFHLLIQYEMQRKASSTLSRILALKSFEDNTSKVFELFQTLKKVLELGEGELELAQNNNYDIILKLHIPFRTSQMMNPAEKKLVKPQILSLSFCKEQSKTNENTYNWHPKPKSLMKNPVARKKESELNAPKNNMAMTERIPSAKVIMVKQPPSNVSSSKNLNDKSNYITSEDESSSELKSSRAHSVANQKPRRPNLKLKVDMDENLRGPEEKFPARTCEEKSIFARKKEKTASKTSKRKEKQSSFDINSAKQLDLLALKETKKNDANLTIIKEASNTSIKAVESSSVKGMDMLDLKNLINRIRPKLERYAMNTVQTLLSAYPDIKLARTNENRRHSNFSKVSRSSQANDSTSSEEPEEVFSPPYHPSQARKPFKRSTRRRNTSSFEMQRFSFTPRLVNYLKDKFEWSDALLTEQLQNVDYRNQIYYEQNEVEENKEKLFILARNFRHKRMWIPQKNFSVYPLIDYSNAKRESHAISILVVDEENYIKERLESIISSESFKILQVNNIFEAFDSYRNYVELGHIFRAVIIDLEKPSFHGMTLFEMIRNFERRFSVKDTFILGVMPNRSGADERDSIVHNVRTTMSTIQKPLDEMKMEKIREYMMAI